MTSEERSEYYKKWIENHPDKRKQYQKEWYQRKKAELKELQKKAAAYDRLMENINNYINRGNDNA